MVLLLWIIYVISVLLDCIDSWSLQPYLLCFVILSCTYVCWCLVVTCHRKGWPLGSRLWCLFVTLSFSHRYPGSGVVLDCIDSWSLPSFLLLKCIFLFVICQIAGCVFIFQMFCKRKCKLWLVDLPLKLLQNLYELPLTPFHYCLGDQK